MKSIFHSNLLCSAECLTRVSTKASARAHKSGASANVDPPDPTGERATFLKMKPDGSSYQSAALDDPLSAAAEMEWEQLSSEVMHFSPGGITQTAFFNFSGKDRFQLVKELSDGVCAVNHFSDYLPTEVVWCPHFLFFPQLITINPDQSPNVF